MNNYSLKSMTEQAIAIKENIITPVQLLEQYFTNIQNEKNSDRIFSEIFYKKAAKEARRAEIRQKNGQRKSFFDGVILNWKDLFDIRGEKCEGGTKLLYGRVSNVDSDVYKNAKKNGLITIGKTHLTELAFSGLGVNPKTETPPNSVKEFLAPGGSSSGAAVATALNLSSAGIGSDTGGSVRIPAAWNNLVGFKPTHGNLSLKGVLKLCPNFDTVGPITKTVTDSFYLYKILKGEKINKFSVDELKNKFFLIDTSFLTLNIDHEVAKSFQLSVNKIKKSGAKIREINFKEIIMATNLAKKLFPYEAYNTWKKNIENNPEKMHPPVLSRFLGGANISTNEYLEAWKELKLLRNDLILKMSDYNAIIAPTCPIMPPLVKNLIESNDYFSNCNLKALRNTRVANLFGLSSISLPTEISNCGLMLLSKPDNEIDLLSTAYLIEQYFKKK